METRKVKSKSSVLLSSENESSSQLERKLGLELKELSIGPNCKDESKLAGYSNESKNAKIMILDETSNENDGDSDSMDDEDVPPPLIVPIVKSDGSSATTTTASTRTTTEISTGPSLMEEMMKEGGASIKKKQNEQKKMEQKKAATAFGGFQKGFLSASKTKRIKKKKRPDTTNQKIAESDIFELDKDGNLIKPTKKIEEIPFIRPSTQKDPLYLDDVQEAMKKNDMNTKSLERLISGEVMKPDVMDKLSQNPRLMAGFKNPKFTAALQAMQENPREAMKNIQGHQDIIDFLNEFCSVMGQHFTDLGEKQEKKNDIGPLAKEALKKEKELNQTPINKDEQDKLDAILSDPELTSLLMDPEMQKVMQECSKPGKMRQYMSDPNYGPKLRKMIQAGLLNVC